MLTNSYLLVQNICSPVLCKMHSSHRMVIQFTIICLLMECAADMYAAVLENSFHASNINVKLCLNRVRLREYAEVIFVAAVASTALEHVQNYW